MDLGDFATYADLTIGPKDLAELLKSLQHTIGGLIEHHRTLFASQRLKLRLASLLLRQEALETESVARQATRHQCRDESGGSRQRLHLDTRTNSLTNQKEAWIRDAWRTGIANQGNGLACLQAFNDRRRGAVFIELMV